MSNKKSYRKYAVTTMAAAAAVASVAPVAISAEETKDFTDVNSNHDFYNEITELTSEGLITGYEDGTFRPQAPIRRVSVANMIHRDLGLEVPKDLDAELDKYVDAKAGDEYDTVIGAVSQAGILTGNSKNEFNPWKDITREQMASVLYRAYDLGQYDAEHVEINLKGVDDSHKNAVQTLANLGITQGTALENFGPLTPISRGQFAAQLSRTLEVVNAEEDVEVAPAVESVSAINAKQIKVTFSQPFGVNGTDKANYLVVEAASGATNTVVDVTKVDDKTVILNLTDAYRVSTDIAVTIDGVYLADSIREKFPKHSEVVNVHDTVAPEIKSVVANTTGTNAAEEVIVTFSEPIKPGATFRINNKTVTATALGTNETTFKISGQNLAVNATHELEVLNAEDYAENKVTSLTKSFTVEADTAAASGQVTTVSDNKVLVKFDKPIVKSSLSNLKFFTFDDSTGGFTAGITVDLDDDVVQVDKLGKEWLFTFPSASTFYQDVNKNTEEILVKANKGVIDTSGNLTKTFEEKVTLTEDVTGPSLTDTGIEKNSKGEVEKLFFEYDELLLTASDELQTNAGVSVPGTFEDVDVANVDDYFKLVNNENNQDVVFSTIFDATDIELASDGKTVVVTVDPATKTVTSGDYKLTSVKGFVLDTAATPNESQKVTKELNIGKVEKVIKADPSVGTDNDFTVDFNQEVTADSAKNPANYKFDGNALPADTIITVKNPKQVTFELPEGFIQVDTDEAKLEINNIKPIDSAYTFENYVGTINVLDNTRPEATGKLLNSGEIFLTFSEAVTNLTVADFDTVKVNGLELNSSVFDVDLAKTEGSDDDNAIKITVNANTETVDGFTYLYIDVDKSGGFNHDKDIVLFKVSGDDAASAWYKAGTDLDGNETDADLNPANLNNVDSVEVITLDQDNTATEDTSTIGNTLKAGTITIK